jgi:hypothetical protein
MSTNDEENGLDPDDLTELQGIFAQMIEDNEVGFVMEFVISRLAAKELVEQWVLACMGDPIGLAGSLHEYAKIMIELSAALEED